MTAAAPRRKPLSRFEPLCAMEARRSTLRARIGAAALIAAPGIPTLRASNGDAR
ncbi:hypothetical protein [Sphingomonas sp. DT-51]|uniref:hypothetical protein n=1 Tax=Sphingomonas sp. DT-51 TaxID=3396165 RepID=UPI003F53F88B